MSKKKVVIALGGNALGNTLPEQMKAVKITARAIVDLVEGGNEVIIVHGNGPQVGIINNAMADYARAENQDPASLSVCVAMSQAYIGYDIQNALREEFLSRGLEAPSITTMVTQVRVDENDPAFQNPTKPIGKFMEEAYAKEQAQKRGWTVREDAGRGYRRVVASPKPKEIIEIGAIRAMADQGDLVICCGGGGIPVVAQGRHLAGVPAVIDKDFAAELLAESLDADMLLILTAVEKVAVRFGRENQEWLSGLTPEQARAYAAQGEFAAGSMLPKVEAGIAFAESKPGRRAVITLLERAKDALKGETGTHIKQ